MVHVHASLMSGVQSGQRLLLQNRCGLVISRGQVAISPVILYATVIILDYKSLQFIPLVRVRVLQMLQPCFQSSRLREEKHVQSPAVWSFMLDAPSPYTSM
jgi:hypothetical protein